jgi:hypothetical protein
MRRKGPVNDPVGEGQPPARSEKTERLRHCGSFVGHMQERFLTHHDIEARARQPGPGDIALDNLHPVFKADQRIQFCRASNTARVQVDADEIGSKPVSPISSRSTEPGTEIRDTISRPNLCTIGQSVICGEPAAVVLVVRIEVLGREILQMPSRSSKLGDDLLCGDRMTRVDVEDVSGSVEHGDASTGFRAQHPPKGLDLRRTILYAYLPTKETAREAHASGSSFDGFGRGSGGGPRSRSGAGAPGNRSGAHRALGVRYDGQL